MSKQEKIFSTKEGNRWFFRNLVYLSRDIKKIQKEDLVIKLLVKNRLRPKKILEIGAANGFRLEALRQKYQAPCFGLEPSRKAIQDGRKRFPKIKFARGTAEKLPFPDASFDLVIINFVFHWLDREKILRTVSEIDRVLENKGQLIIGDFYPPRPAKFHYHHLPKGRVFTYTQNYAEVFLASNLYKVMAKFIKTPGRNLNRRFVVSLLKKDVDANYPLKKI